MQAVNRNVSCSVTDGGNKNCRHRYLVAVQAMTAQLQPARIVFWPQLRLQQKRLSCSVFAAVRGLDVVATADCPLLETNGFVVPRSIEMSVKRLLGLRRMYQLPSMPGTL